MNDSKNVISYKLTELEKAMNLNIKSLNLFTLNNVKEVIDGAKNLLAQPKIDNVTAYNYLITLDNTIDLVNEPMQAKRI